jgi:Flp pilus assembly protein TadG
MNAVGGSSESGFLRSEQGQIIWWLPLLMILFFGMAGLTLDLGRAYVAYRELQSSTDAAALAGAYAMVQSGATQTSVNNQVAAYSSKSSGANYTPTLPGAAVSTTYKCITDNAMIAAPCTGPNSSNVLQVMQTSTIPMYFMRTLSLFGVNAANSMTLRAYATATPMAGSNTQVNVAVVLDTTASMQQSDSSCGKSKIACALSGVQTMLSQLTPCSSGSTSSNCKSAFDSVSLFTYPNVQANQASRDTSCGSGSPKILGNTAPSVPSSGNTSWTAPTGTAGTYQITGYLDDYSSNNQLGGSISSSSALGVATGAGSCSGMQAVGGVGTYFAGAIYAAQTSLMAQQALNPNSQNMMIILSDGDAGASSGDMNFGSTKSFTYTDSTGKSVTYPSSSNQCHQGVAAANYATSLGTTVFSIAYNASGSGCSSDKNGYSISPCSTMQQMSSGYSSGTTSHFYSSGGSCGSSNSLNKIFKSIAAQFTAARLVPNGIS